jgi:predicted 3-demethylubiquinone-9 3-methyltransferase (glyoxalase superfamily)
MQKIYPCLWFDHQAEQAAEFYVSVFKNSRIIGAARYGDAAAKASGKAAGSVMTVSFEIEGQKMLALNGGPQFAFSPAISLVVSCQTQKEIDALWAKLSADPDGGQCGWLTDKFGVSWQIVPAALAKMAASKDGRKAERAMQALLRMRKLDLKALQAAYGRK